MKLSIDRISATEKNIKVCIPAQIIYNDLRAKALGACFLKSVEAVSL